MCGIAGGVALSRGARPDPERVARMSCLVEHRGPDGEGLWTAPSGRAVLAHRRLSVIDLVTGGQPMVAREGRLGLVFNGEIYNYRELRATLAERGAQFRTGSDTEVLLRLLERSGSRCVDELRGMFAFAFWDDDAGRLTVARDRIGKKPFYYVIEDGCLYFASSLRALRDSTPTRRAVDPVALDEYLTLGYVPAPATIYVGVRKLEAGTVAEASIGDSALTVRRYWDVSGDDGDALEPFAGSFEDAVDRADELLTEAVSLRLRSDVPLGVFLSGGIDSSLVAATAARQSTTPVLTFSIGMDVAAFDESEYASAVAAHLGTTHHTFRARPDLLATLPEMVAHFGEPFADASALPTWMLARETRKHVTVALGGDGGDELFAGYPWYQTAARMARISRGVAAPALALASRTLDGALGFGERRVRSVGRVRRGLAMLAHPGGAERFAALRSFIGRGEAELLYAGDLRDARREAGPGGAGGRRLAQLYRDATGSDMRRMRVVDMATYLADGLMPKVDVATMAFGLEARAPLLDQELARFALSLPDEYLIAPDGSGKRVLRALLARHVPSALFERPKQGFDVPMGHWFSGSVRDAVTALPRSERLRASGWLAPAGIATLVDEHLAGRRDHSQRLFSILMLDEWLKAQ